MASRHILIAEDEGLVAMLLEAILTDAGYRVTVAGNGVLALAAWSEDRADMVIADVRMPKMGGVELVRRLREDEPLLPALMVTGWVECRSEMQELVVSAPHLTAVLEKPARLPEIERAVSTLLPGPVAVG